MRGKESVDNPITAFSSHGEATGNITKWTRARSTKRKRRFPQHGKEKP